MVGFNEFGQNLAFINSQLESFGHYLKVIRKRSFYIKFIIRMRSKATEEQSKFVLPSGVATSGTELKSLQHKLLQNYYSNNTQLNQYPYTSSKGLSSDAKSTKKSELFVSNVVQKDKFLSQYDVQAKIANEKQRSSLTSDLIAQMDYKNLKKQYERHQSLEEEGKLIKNTSKFDSLEKEKIKQFNNKYKMEAEEDRQLKQQRKFMDLNLQQYEKEFYKNRYSLGGFARSESVGSLPKSQVYSNPTKQYYYEIENAMRSREFSNQSNPETLRRNSSFKITNNNERMQHLDNMYNSSLKQHYSHQGNMLQSFKAKQMRQKQDLRQVLLNQIREKQQSNKLQRRNHQEIPYATKDYKFVHHPINNPVDFKYAHDNKYVIGELKSIK